MTLEELEIIVKGDTTDVTKKLQQLKAQIENIVQGTISKVSQQAQPNFTALKQSVESVSTAVSNASSNSAKSFEILGREIEHQKKKVMELRKQYEDFNTYKDLKTKLENREISLNDYLTQKSTLPNNLKDVSDQLEQAEIKLEKLSLRAENMRSKMKQAGEEAKKTGEKVSQSMNKSSKDVQKATKHTSKFLQTFSRIIRVMVVRGVINETIQGFNDLTKASEEYNKSMSNIQSSMLQARNSITSAFAPAIQMLEPYLVSFAEIVSDLFTKIAMYSSAFAGNNFYYKATKVTTDYAKSLGKVANEQKRVLAGFDELNVLSENEKGKGTTGLPDAEEMFERVEIPQDVLNKVADFKQKLQELLPILEAIGITIAGYKIGELLGLWGKSKDKVDALTKAFKDKNSALGDQQGEYAKEKAWLKSLVPAFGLTGVAVWGLSSALQNLKNNPIQLPSLEPVVEYEKAFQTAEETVTKSMENAKENAEQSVKDTTDALTNAVPMIDIACQEAGDKIVKTEEVVSKNTKTTMDAIGTNLENFGLNIETGIAEWSDSVTENTSKTFENITESSKQGFEKTHKNTNTFVEAVSKGIKNLCHVMSQNTVNTIVNMVDSFTSGFQKIWDDFVGLMQGLGESISNWWHANKNWVVPTVVAGLTIATGVALAPYTGGASLGLAALAEGGVLTKPTPVLAGEYA